MRRTMLYIQWMAVSALLLTGCKKYLTIQPEDRLTEDQVFASENSIQQAMNGLYRNMSSSALYGLNLTNTVTEVLAQRYNVPTSTSGPLAVYNQFRSFGVTQVLAKNELDRIWKAGYATIQKANNFAAKMDKAVADGVITSQKASLMKGEAVAIRAIIHFDLLRLFGPVYVKAPDIPAIPYYRSADVSSQPVISSIDVIDSVIADLQEAASLLSNDPVIKNGIRNSGDYYELFRNQKFNYYAVNALMARVYLYAGRKTEAQEMALMVLAEGEKWFPWTPRDSIVTDKLNPDRIFSKEVFFALYNQDMYTTYNSMFSPNLQDVSLLAPLPARLAATFEGNENDYRYLNLFLIGGTKTYRTLHKYADISSSSRSWRFLQPMIRKTELYYILAETADDPSTAIDYLNTVRFNRGLVPLPNGVAIQPEILKEYQKEFWGEGQLFFYYKRHNITSLPSAVNAAANVNATNAYNIALPESETKPR